MSEIRFDPALVRALLDAFESSDWNEMSVQIGADSLRVSRSSNAVWLDVPAEAEEPGTAAPVAAQPPAPEEEEPASEPTSPRPSSGTATGIAVESPTVGIFWVAPSPGAPPFVEVGSRVGPDEIVGIVEVMKLMNQVPAGAAGVVTEILVGNGEAVEFGQPLVIVEPDPG